MRRRGKTKDVFKLKYEAYIASDSKKKVGEEEVELNQRPATRDPGRGLRTLVVVQGRHAGVQCVAVKSAHVNLQYRLPVRWALIAKQQRVGCSADNGIGMREDRLIEYNIYNIFAWRYNIKRSNYK